MRVKIHEVLVLKDRSKRIAEDQIGMAFGKGGPSHTGSLVGYWGKRLRT
jgi:hypothetical protein